MTTSTGGVYRRKDSSFYWMWFFDRQGKRYCRSTKTTNGTQAYIELRRTLEQVKHGEKIATPRQRSVSLENELMRTLSEQECTGLKAVSTARKDLVRLQAFFQYCSLHDVKSVDEIDSDVLQDFLAWLPANVRRVSPVTANRYVDAVRGLLHKKIRIKKNREHESAGRLIPQDLFENILAEADPTYRKFLILLAETGLRTGHLCRVETAWIKKESGQMFIDFPLGFSRGRKRAPKIPLSRTASVVIDEMRRQPRGRFLFDRGDGQPLYTSMRVHQLWRQIRNHLGFEGRPHDLRHTFAIREMRRTKNLIYVSKMLGHSTPATTAAIYQQYDAMMLSEILGDANPSGIAVEKPIRLRKAQLRSG